MKKLLLILPLFVFGTGCNSAAGPDPAAADAAIASLDKMSPQEWFDNLQKQPLSKFQKIASIDQKKNLTEADRTKFKEIVNAGQ